MIQQKFKDSSVLIIFLSNISLPLPPICLVLVVNRLYSLNRKVWNGSRRGTSTHILMDCKTWNNYNRFLGKKSSKKLLFFIQSSRQWMYHGGTASWRLFWTQNIPLLDIHLKPLYCFSQFLCFFFSINFNTVGFQICVCFKWNPRCYPCQTLFPELQYNFSAIRRIIFIIFQTIPSAETVVSPIELEMIRDEQNKEVLEQRRLMVSSRWT